MADEKKIQVIILNTPLILSTNEPKEKEELAAELNQFLTSLLNKYPGSDNNMILTFAALKIFEENKQLEKEIKRLADERDKLNKVVQGALYNINVD
ncbi:MAG: cell division protein ZapA [Candidatus Cloacimonetes bacterium]|nr:cell division protein ZapA [Candidatus Cloacimonadota bacterium]